MRAMDGSIDYFSYNGCLRSLGVLVANENQKVAPPILLARHYFNTFTPEAGRWPTGSSTVECEN